ncbi:MAG: 4-(cytidine 5'-diphospho)-2-C-methyl-D-erythritol kinase [Paracoccaceae bacterium]
MSAAALAPAKLNLALHVTGRRADGRRELDSVVAFADIGDRLGVAPARALSLRVTGPFAPGVPSDDRNLVLRAARWLAARHGVTAGARLTLDKHLPHPAGIGGGTSDAACALRLLAALWDVPAPTPDAADLMTLGADLPACLSAPAPCRMSGAGEVIAPVPPLPPWGVVLVNPGVPMPTGRVFAALEGFGAPLPGPVLPSFAWLATTRNDLQPPATVLAPVVAQVLAALSALPGARLARMSGSGATCFALFDDAAAARRAVQAMPRTDWWVRAGRLLPAEGATRSN